MLRKIPVIVILGSTGTGKTKLSIELARRFNAEIISADSMQVYKGLSIATAKATNDEQMQAPHHLLDIATPHEPFTVTHFRDKALPIIDNLLQRSKSPIIVGGTNYYIESILWHNLVSPGVGCKRKIDDTNYCDELTEDAKDFLDNSATNEKMLEIESTKLYEYLKLIDPATANKLHPNNKRKIMRALEVFKDHGKRLSDIIEDQRKLPGASNLGGPKRFEHVIIFWLQCDQAILNHRLNSRVDSMVKDGLLVEIRSFYDEYVKNRDADYEEGILQTIGFKEFIPYLEKYDKSHDDLINKFVEAPETLPEPDGYKSLLYCLDELKLVTQRYSKKQIKWIKNRFLGSEVREVPKVYPLDTSDVSKWKEVVYQPAEETMLSYIAEEPIKLKALEKVKRLGDGLNEETTHYCKVCDRIFIGDFQWQLHIKSNNHKRKNARQNKLEKNKKESEEVVEQNS
ncbi:unnamed protein product [Chironomus riparius]|uniref:C2H2-type domain-containing protein n=1 Tax=Chironomus riparius TaxID=315576 RepID=A0A9P0NGD7_9DIPT|nr:unnamed protein product [Chironomus riparius]